MKLTPLAFGAIMMLGACATSAMSSREELRSVNALPAPPDYVQLVVTPYVNVDGVEQLRASYDCRLRNREGATGAEGNLRDFFLNTRNRDALAGLTVRYNTRQGSEAANVEHTIRIFEMEARNRGRKCDTKVSVVQYETPLFMNTSGQSFELEGVSAQREQFDDSLLEATREGVAALGVWAGVPAPIAEAAGGFAQSQLRDATLAPSGSVRFAVGTGNRQAVSANVVLLDINSRQGRLEVGARANVLLIGSVLEPMEMLVPNLSLIDPSSYVRQRMIGRTPISQAVDRDGRGGWTAFHSEPTDANLNARCIATRDELERTGYSASDAAALVWLMTQSHPRDTARTAMIRASCLADRESSLRRFGVTLPDLRPPSAVEATEVLRDQQFRQFMTGDRLARVAAARSVFVGEPVRTADRGGSFFVSGENVVRTPDDWVAYMPHPAASVQCVTVISDASRDGGPIGFAVIERAAGDTRANGVPVIVMAEFAQGLERPGQRFDVRIRSIAVAEDQSAAASVIRRATEANNGGCLSDERPALIFPAPQTAN